VDARPLWHILNQNDCAHLDGDLDQAFDLWVVQFGANETHVEILLLQPVIGLLLRVDKYRVHIRLVHDQSVVCAQKVLGQTILVPVTDLEVVTEEFLDLEFGVHGDLIWNESL
jgi:hypothetical protein